MVNSNRRDGVNVKVPWQDADSHSRNIHVTINRDTPGGKICQILVNGPSSDEGDYVISGHLLQQKFDVATCFLARLIQYGECPREMLEALRPAKHKKQATNPKARVIEAVCLEVAVLEVVVEEMDKMDKCHKDHPHD